MDTERSESEFAARLKSAIETPRAVDDHAVREAFTARLKRVAARPDVVPIESDGRKIDARRDEEWNSPHARLRRAHAVRNLSRRRRIRRGQPDSDARDGKVLAALASIN